MDGQEGRLEEDHLEDPREAMVHIHLFRKPY